MKTSLVSTAASSLSVSTSASASIKADRPQQLKSVTVYFRGRKMVLMQRPQRRLSLLLCRMLRRSMLSLLGRLRVKLAAPLAVPVKRVLSAGALCAMALASATTAHATASAPLTPPPANTLPTGYSLQSGTVTDPKVVGNQMTLDIGSNKAVINWNSFSIGSGAGVDFHFANATSSSSVLNRVTGNDPSQIMGSLSSNGKVFLINSAGILVGKTAKIDVAGFVASTLNISNVDFLAGKMHFQGKTNPNVGPNAGVMIEQDGSIKTSEGGSVYLIGSTVENDGVITSPNGEVLLAAGKSVDLVDTGTPGVKITVKGNKGKITNLGKIMVDTGVIGFGAALIDNRGMLNASSVDKAGGRIFLRASKDLTTTETSTINADGTTGGNVVLYADNSADIGGDVSATGSSGNGGYVDTSGKKMLAVKYVPRVGSGGQWYIDPDNVDIVADDGPTQDHITLAGGAITASSSGSVIHVGTINGQLNTNVSVTISTGTSDDNEAGDITVKSGANILRSGGTGANLTLTAAHNITIESGASIIDSSTGHMDLTLTATGGAIASEGLIQLKGDLIATAASYTSNGTTALAGGNMNVTTSGNQILGTVTGAGAFNFTTTAGAISQNAGTTLAGNSIIAAAVTGITLGNAGNSIANSFAASNGTSGDIAFVNSATSTLSLGALSNSNGGISINTAGRANTTSQISAAKGLASIVAAGITVNSSGIIARDISLTSTGINALNVNGKLQASALNGTVTVVSGGDLTVEQTSCISAPVSAGGLVSMTAAGNLTVQSDVTAHDISLTTAATGTGNINVTGDLMADAENGTVTLQSAGGIVTSGSGNSVIHAGGTVSMTAAGNLNSQADVTAHDISLTTAATGTGNINVTGDLTANAENGTVTLQSAGAIVTGPNSIWSDNSVISAGGTVSMTAAGSLISQTDVTAHDISLTTTGGGDITANGNLTANATSGTITMSSGGAIEIGRDSGLNYYHNDINAGGLVSLTSVGEMALDGNSLSGGNINLKTTGAGGDIYLYSFLSTLGTLTVESARGIAEQAEVGITAGTVNATAHNGGINLGYNGNYIGTFIGKAEATGEGSNDISLVNSQDLLLGNVSSSQGNINIETTGNMTVGAENANVTLSAQQINLTTRKGEEGGQGEGEGFFVVVGGGDGASNMTINAKLNASAQEHGVVLSSDGAITQAVGAGGINTNTLDINSNDGTALLSDANHIGALSALNYETGDIVINNASAELLLNGNIDNEATGGNISITNTGKITASTNLMQDEGDGFFLDTGIFADNKVTLTSTTGDITLAQVIATDLVVSAAQGAIKSYSNQDSGDLISLQISGAMTASAKAGITLHDNSNVTFGNHIANFSATNSSSGDITLVNHNTESSNNLLAITNSGSGDITVTNYGGLTTSGAITGHGNVGLTAWGDSSSGAISIGGAISAQSIAMQTVIGENEFASTDIAINGALTAIDGVNLASGAGAITQSEKISAGLLSATAVKGITLDLSSNEVSSFSAANQGSGNASAAGNIVFKNTSVRTATGILATGNITNSAGNISIENTGRMDVNGAVSAPNGSVSLVTHSPLNVNGTVNANGNINFAAGDVNNATITDGITISAAVTSATGTVGFSSLNVSLNALVDGPGGINIQAHTVNITVPPLQQPHIDITPGVPDPVVVSTPPPVVVNTTVDQNVASTSNNVNNITDTTTPVTTTQTNTVNNTSNQTAGGGDGEFGGSNDDGKGKDEKSNKPTPMCT